LSEELLQHPDWLLAISDMHRTLSVADYKEHLCAFLKVRSVTPPTALDLALFRRKELLRIVVRDALGLTTLPELTEELSNLADAILAGALGKVTSELIERYGSPPIEGASGAAVPAAFTVLALGKLGGR